MEAPRGCYAINAKNVVLLYFGAVSQKDSECLSACLDFMCENLKVENCLEYLTFGSKHDCDKLLMQGILFILENINEVGQLHAFFELENDLMSRLITAAAVTLEDVSKSNSATDLLEHVYSWMEFEREKRAQVFINISKKFPMKLVESRVLKMIVMEDEDVGQDQDLRKKYLLAIEEQYSAEKDREQVQSRDPDSGGDNSETTENSTDSDREGLEKLQVEKIKDTETVDTKPNILVNQQMEDMTHPKVIVKTEPLISEIENRQGKINEATAAIATKSPTVTKPPVENIGETNSSMDIKPLTLENRQLEVLRETNADIGTRLEISENQHSQTINESGTSKNLDIQNITGASTDTNTRNRKRKNEESNMEYVGFRKRNRDAFGSLDLSSWDPFTLGIPLGSTKVIKVVVFKQKQIVSHTPGVYFVAGPMRSRALYFLSIVDLKVYRDSGYPSNQECLQAMFYHPKAALLGIACSDINAVSFPGLRLYDLKKNEWRIGGQLKDGARSTGQIWKCFVQGDLVFFLTKDSVYMMDIANLDLLDCPVLDCVYGPRGSNNNSRICFSGALMGNKFYMISGRTTDKDGTHLTKKVVTYDSEKMFWKRRADILIGRIYPAVAVFNSKIYVFGGGGNIKGQLLSSCEVYDPGINIWTLIAPLHQQRAKAGTFILNRQIYVVGGNEGMPTLERYDPLQNAWTLLGELELGLPYWQANYGFYHNLVQMNG